MWESSNIISHYLELGEHHFSTLYILYISLLLLIYILFHCFLKLPSYRLEQVDVSSLLAQVWVMSMVNRSWHYL